MAGDDAVSRPVGDPSVVREVFDRLPIMAVGLSGADHRYVATNEAYRRFLDGRPDLLGRPVREALPDVRGQRVVELLDRVYRTGETESGREWRVQFAPAAPGAAKELYVDFTVTPHRVDGAITGLIVHAQDVTERVRQRDRSLEPEGPADPVRDSMLALQEALLPDGLPVLPGVDIAGRYLVADTPDAGGGDWFDAVPLGGGRVALVVGDVVGHGVPATAVMGQLRAVLADQFAGGADVVEAVQRAQRYAERHPAARAATLCAAVLDPATGAVSYVTCGHPAPLVVTPDGGTRFLAPSGGTPLGTDGDAPVATATLGPEELLVLYSDGLVERPGVALATGQAELAEVAGDTAANRAFRQDPQVSAVQRVCAQTVELVARDSRLADDVTVLVAQRRSAPVSTFEQDMPARSGLLALLRQRLEGWLRGLGAGSEDLFSAQIAVVEAVTNAVEHAYPGGPPGEVRVRGRLDGSGAVELTVRDFGRWRPVDPEPGLRGRGLVLIHRCMHSVVVNRAAEGTTVVMRRLLRSEPFLDPLTSGRTVTPGPDQPVEFASRVRAGGPDDPVRVEVSGPVDMASVPRLRATLNEAGRGGVLPLTLDLQGVTHLGSSGIQLLADQASSGRQRLRLIAEPGSIARHILDLTGLGHLAMDDAEPEPDDAEPEPDDAEPAQGGQTPGPE